jgi:CheY-like chemotaxis protein
MAADGEAALKAVMDSTFDCIVIDADADLNPSALREPLQQLDTLQRPAIILYGDAAAIDDSDWKQLAEITVVRACHSPERLLDQSLLLLHRDVSMLPERKRQILRDLHESDKLLAGRKVLIVDDDMRNIFALTTVLEEHDMVISSADNGRAAIRTLQEKPDIDVVLMDIMMPEMDGIDTMREIRKHPHLRDLPIIAVTAKAMKGDREKCIEAGAWDYLAKPVDTEQLLAVLRAWLHR